MAERKSTETVVVRGVRFWVGRAVLLLAAACIVCGLLLFGGVICFHGGIHAGRFKEDCNECKCMPGGGVACTAVDCVPKDLGPKLSPSGSP